jgi:UDP-perosamine 4-acetyltransferase
MEKVLLVGAGGHCKVILSIIDKTKYIPFGISDEDPNLFNKEIDGYKILYNELQWQKVREFCSNAIVSFGSVNIPFQRRKVWEKLKKICFKFPIVIAKNTIIDKNVKIGDGTVIMPGVIINTGTVIGENCIINTGTVIDHDCEIGDHTHIAPGVTCSGGVSVGEMTHIGTGASVIQGISIGAYSLVAAGSVLVKDVEENSKVKGVPARTF